MLNHLLTCRHWTKPWRKTPTMPNGSANVPTLTHCSKTINVSLHLSFRGRQYVASSTIIKPIASFILCWTTITQWFRSNTNVYGIILSGIVSRSVCRSSVSDISIICFLFSFYLNSRAWLCCCQIHMCSLYRCCRWCQKSTATATQFPPGVYANRVRTVTPFSDRGQRLSPVSFNHVTFLRQTLMLSSHVWFVILSPCRIAEYHLNHYEAAHSAFTQGQQLDGEHTHFPQCTQLNQAVSQPCVPTMLMVFVLFFHKMYSWFWSIWDKLKLKGFSRIPYIWFLLQKFVSYLFWEVNKQNIFWWS